MVSLCVQRDVTTRFKGKVRDTPAIPLVSLCVHRDVPATPLGTLCVHRPCQGYTHNPTGLRVRSQGSTYTSTGIPVSSQGPHRKSLLNTYPSQFPSLPSNLSVFFTSSFSVFCLQQILSTTLMGPVPSHIHNVSLRLGLVISVSQIIILPTRLNPLTPATQSVHFSLLGSPQPWHLFFEQFLMTLSSNITSSLSLYWSCTAVRSRNAHSCHTVMSLKSLNPNLSWSSQPHIFKVSHLVIQSLLMAVITTNYYGPRHPNILASQYLYELSQRSALSQHNPMYQSH